MPSPSVSRSSGFVPRAISSPSVRPSPSVSALRMSVPSRYSCRFVRPSRSKSSAASVGSCGFKPRATSTSSGIPSPSASALDGAMRIEIRPDAPSCVAWTSTIPALTAVTRPLPLTVAIAELLIVYCVPVASAVTSRVVLLAYAAVTVSCSVDPRAVRRDAGAVTVTVVGMGVSSPNTIRGTFTAPFGGTRNGSDSPEIVLPSMMHVARARTGPKFAGTLGRTHVPSGLTRTFRLSTLTVQFSLSCANASRAGHTASRTSASRRTKRVAVVVTMSVVPGARRASP